jgi:hypothetical protein
MGRLFADTTVEAEAVLVALLRSATPAAKLRMVAQLNAGQALLIQAGLRRGLPEAGAQELRRRLAGRLLGEAVAVRAYGTQPLSTDPLSATTVPPMDETAIDVTLKVTAALEALGVAYVLVGSLASAVYGAARSTLGSDLVATLRPEQVDEFAGALRAEFYVSVPAIEEAIQRHGSFNLIHLKTIFKVDVFIARPGPFDARQLDRGRPLIVTEDPPRVAMVASPEDTILAKLAWYRAGGETSERQWRDVQAIVATQGSTLDVAYLRQTAPELAVADLLDQALAEFLL